MRATWYAVDLPRAEAKHLPLVDLVTDTGCPMPGEIRAGKDGRVFLDYWAVMSLWQLAGRSGFAVQWDGDLPVLAVGADRYVLKQENAAPELSG